MLILVAKHRAHFNKDVNMLFSSLVILIVTIVAGVFWLYDAIFNLPKRKKGNIKEPKAIEYARGIFLIFFIISLVKVFNVGILLLLVLLTFASFIVWLLDLLFFRKARLSKKEKEPLIIEYANSLFPIFLIVLIIRSFVCEPFVVPSGSLEPTVMPGDYLIVNQFIYGLRLPVINTKILNITEPKIGDIVVFHDPSVSGKDLIKRVVGAPGDHVVYKNRVLYINGVEAKQTFIKNGLDFEPSIYGGNTPVKFMQENLQGIQHQILLFEQNGKMTDFDVVVPKNYYFMMGDNRDNSADSRVWGFMPEDLIIGKAWLIFFSWDHGVKWSRIGMRL